MSVCVCVPPEKPAAEAQGKTCSLIIGTTPPKKHITHTHHTPIPLFKPHTHLKPPEPPVYPVYRALLESPPQTHTSSMLRIVYVEL